MNIRQMMMQARKMQDKIDKAKLELANKEFKIEKTGVTLLINGNRKVKSININPALIDPEDKETLEDLMIIAINEANHLIDEAEKAINSSQQGTPF